MYKERLVETRENYNLKQYEIADFLNIYKGTYNQYETEYVIMPLKHLIAICNKFNISLDYIFNFTNKLQYNNSIKEIDNIKVGAILKNWRKENKITQSELAKILNTTQSVIADYERGRYLISTSFLYDICKRFKVSADYLLGRIN